MSLLASGAALLFPIFLHICFDRRYWPVAGVAQVLILGYLCHSWFAFLQLPLIHARRSGLVAFISATALACNIALNFAWIPRFGLIGAAYATLAAYAIEALLAAAIGQRVFFMPWGFRRPVLALSVCAATLLSFQFPVAAPVSTGAGVILLAIALAVFLLRRREVVESAPEEPPVIEESVPEEAAIDLLQQD
jgi:O-antigen/teichoic acid export membrane protein